MTHRQEQLRRKQNHPCFFLVRYLMFYAILSGILQNPSESVVDISRSVISLGVVPGLTLFVGTFVCSFWFTAVRQQ